jgi:hypothetical protein
MVSSNNPIDFIAKLAGRGAFAEDAPRRDLRSGEKQ